MYDDPAPPPPGWRGILVRAARSVWTAVTGQPMRGALRETREWAQSEWDGTQAGWMIALGTYEATLCPLCGGDRAECWDAENMDRYDVEDPTRCHRATAMHKKQKDYADQPDSSALLWRADLRR